MSPFGAGSHEGKRAPDRRRRLTSARSALCAACVAVAAAVLLAACGGGKSGSTANTSTPGTTSTSATATSTVTSTSTATAVTGTVVSPGLVKASAAGVTATLRAGTHKPHVNAAWPIHFRVLEGGAPAKSHVSYEYLFNGAVVAKRSHYAFSGRFSDVFRWPPSSVGYPLTFRAVIVAGGHTLYLDYPVEVQR